MTAERARVDAAARERATAAANASLLDLPEMRAALARGGRVAGFVATRSELDPAPALAEARRGGATVALPRVRALARVPAGVPRLGFHVAAPDGGDLRRGPFGILEPVPTAAEVAPGDVDVMIVPGLAFDATGGRVGYGGGFYDEVLADVARRPACVVGFGFGFQVVASCPAGDHDVRVDRVVTDAGVIDCSPPVAPSGDDGGGGSERAPR